MINDLSSTLILESPNVLSSYLARKLEPIQMLVIR